MRNNCFLIPRNSKSRWADKIVNSADCIICTKRRAVITFDSF